MAHKGILISLFTHTFTQWF